MNKKIISVATLAAVFGTMVAAPAMAMVTSTTPAPAKTAVNFCTNLTKYSANADLKIAELDKKWSQTISERTVALEKKRNEREAKLAATRSAADLKRAASYEKLMGKATTDDQKAAVTKFQSAVDTAVAARKSAVDGAISTYRTGIDSAMTARRTALDAALVKFTAAVKAAEEKAAIDCAVTGAKPYEIRTTAMASIKIARDQFRADRLAAPKVGDAIKTLQAARKTAVEKAAADFKAAVDTAKAELKAAFPVKTKTSTAQ